MRDPVGSDLPDDDAAREYALLEIRELLSTTMGKRLDRDCLIEVCDAEGHMLFSVNCKDA